jgi:hypothetical protein
LTFGTRTRERHFVYYFEVFEVSRGHTSKLGVTLVTVVKPVVLPVTCMASADSFPTAAKEVVDPFEAAVKLHIEWPSGAKLVEGAALTPTQVQDIPRVCFDGAKDKLYCIVLRCVGPAAFRYKSKSWLYRRDPCSDPDAPNAAEPKFKEWQHWVHVNAPAEDFIKGGDSITAYVGSAPGKDSGFHRYVAVLYEQAARIEPDEARIPANRYLALYNALPGPHKRMPILLYAADFLLDEASTHALSLLSMYSNPLQQ